MSRADALVAIAASDDAEGTRLCAPAVGILRGVPEPGRVLGSGAPFASLIILGRAHPLLVPEGMAGVVSALEVGGFGNDTIPVEYAQPILTLAPIQSPRVDASGGRRAGKVAAARSAGRSASAAQGARGLTLPEGCHAVVCPADGVFYRRPRPTDDAYVEVGSSVRTGQTLGLIEAMKTFSPIPYGGPGLPSPATIVEIRAGDSQEVRHGQLLFVVR